MEATKHAPSQEPAAQRKKTLAYLALVFFIYLVSGMNVYRVVPIMTRVRSVLGVGEGLAGLLVSANTFMSLFLSIPFGIALRRLGFRKAGLVAALLMLAGSALGAVTTHFALMMLSQILIGTGGALVTVIYPNFTLVLSSEKNRSTALGVVNSAQVIAQFLMYNIAPRITTDQNISPAWWLTCAACLVLLGLWIAFVRKKIAPVDVTGQPARSTARKKGPSIGQVLSDRRLVLLMVGIFCYMISAMSVLSFLPSYLQQERGMDLITASGLCSVNALVGFVSSPLCGLLADKLNSRKWIYFGLVIIMAVLRILQVVVPSGPVYPLIIFLQGIPAGGVPLVMGAASQICKDESLQPLAVSMVSTGNMGGIAVATLLGGAMIQAIGYNATFLFMAPFTLLALLGMMTSKDIH